MLELDTKIELDDKAVKSPNLADRFDQRDLDTLGDWVVDGYKRDRSSRYKWERRNEAAMDLAMQIQKEKSFPWPGSSNIAFPLVTIGVLQYHATAMPVLVGGPDLVKMRVIGDDNDGQKVARARRVATHMSYQMLEEDQPWEEQHDRLFINNACVGTSFIKTFYEPRLGHPVSELVLARDLVVDYWAKSVEAASRKTHVIPCNRNSMHEKIMRRTFRDVRGEDWYKVPAQPQQENNDGKRDNRRGQMPSSQTDETTPWVTLEQHVEVDLDGDGYAEPYVITVEEASKSVLRIVTGFDRIEDIERTRRGEIINIRAMQYFTKYGFIPSPDGGLYDIGFGVLLGPLNESVNSLLNQIVDSGTMSVTAGGFLGRGAKLKGGIYTFGPFQWHTVDSSGDDLRKNVFPLPVREPSAVLFQLLSLIINYTNRVSGAVDVMVGENPGQNTKAETMQTMVQQGMKIYTGIYKRQWRSMKEEFKKRYILNGLTMGVTARFKGTLAMREDYLADPETVVPAADPHLSSDSVAMTQAAALKQSAMTTQGYNEEAVERRWLRALKVDNIDEVFPGRESPKATKKINPKVQIEQLKQQMSMAELQDERQRFVIEIQEQVRKNSAEIALMFAQIQKLQADAETDARNSQISAVNAAVNALKNHNDFLLKQIEHSLKAIEIGLGASDGAEGKDKGGEGAGTPGGTVLKLEGASGNKKGNGDARPAAGGGA